MIPNILSSIRICLVPVFAIVYFSGLPHAGLIAAGVYLLASITDVLDGAIARKFNMITPLGRILDPLGDKLMTFTVLLCISIDGIIPLWAFVIFCVKELCMGVGGLIIHKKTTDVPSSNYFGKFSTAVFFVVCVILIIFKDIPQSVATWMITFAIVMMMIAFISYIIMFAKLLKSLNGSAGEISNEAASESDSKE